MLDSSQEQQLTSGGDCQLHWHSVDRQVRHEDLLALQSVMNRRSVTTDPYTVTENDDLLLCPSGGTINFPLSKNNGREFEVVMTGTDPVTVDFSGSDTLYGEPDVLLSIQGTALHFKSVSGGWVLI